MSKGDMLSIVFMNKRRKNIIDELIDENTGHSRLILNMACISFDLGKELFGEDYLSILKEYIKNNRRNVDEIVSICSMSHSSYYRKINKIYEVIYKMIKLVNDAFLEIKMNDNYIKSIIGKTNK